MHRNRDRAGWPAPRTGQLTITGLALPSNVPAHSFQADLAGRWEEIPAPRPHHDPRAAAAHHAVATARAVASQYPLTELHAAQVHLNSRLGAESDLADAPVRLLWATVHLTATDHDLAAVTALHRRMQDEALNEQVHRQRQQRAEELHQALATTPTLALTYWLTHHPDTSDDTLKAVDRLSREITAHAPQNAWVQIARLLQTFVAELTTKQRLNLAESLTHIVIRYDQPHLAEQLRAITLSMSSEDNHARPDPPPG
ncbi:hypothetical protein [Streptomyces sp. NBC_00859]|uniref:hypothetical protein n=1 Tax=Streptomyces sp. NBC_00859 TaxID=2903682 RepID=UPI00386DE042|nr:hypothetical protein OG584_00095 [Streptomyces sp. NBC_00859]WSZ86778.1 hypothetical protein OG584_35045 [Streptomyces sp. NBC_00859]